MDRPILFLTGFKDLPDEDAHLYNVSKLQATRKRWVVNEVLEHLGLKTNLIKQSLHRKKDSGKVSSSCCRQEIRELWFNYLSRGFNDLYLVLIHVEYETKSLKQFRTINLSTIIIFSE